MDGVVSVSVTVNGNAVVSDVIPFNMPALTKWTAAMFSDAELAEELVRRLVNRDQ